MSTTTNRRRLARPAIAGTAIVAAMAGFAGIASAAPLDGAGSATAPTTKMTITNDTGYTLWRNGSTNPHGM
ncbi:hypothetical protein [Smaragdicoccus niigatensis]|uniref:hypothetical protein n=1 Tax=Smaragdicoccus niigatensis TaxID=359359 RepID=UPI000371B9C8|nr:hypothetical protein [Smaragdicoccus niigatensis]